MVLLSLLHPGLDHHRSTKHSGSLTRSGGDDGDSGDDDGGGADGDDVTIHRELTLGQVGSTPTV